MLCSWDGSVKWQDDSVHVELCVHGIQYGLVAMSAMVRARPQSSAVVVVRSGQCRDWPPVLIGVVPVSPCVGVLRLVLTPFLPPPDHGDPVT